jgi:hypothetical protein
MAEIDEQTQLKPRAIQIIEQLRTVFVDQLGHRLDLNDDLVETDIIRLVLLLQFLSLILQGQHLLGGKRNATFLEFYCETFLIDTLEKTAAHRFICLKASTDDSKTFFFV